MNFEKYMLIAISLSDTYKDDKSYREEIDNLHTLIDSKKNIVSGWMKKEKIAKIIRKQIELKLK